MNGLEGCWLRGELEEVEAAAEVGVVLELEEEVRRLGCLVAGTFRDLCPGVIGTATVGRGEVGRGGGGTGTGEGSRAGCGDMSLEDEDLRETGDSIQEGAWFCKCGVNELKGNLLVMFSLNTKSKVTLNT